MKRLSYLLISTAIAASPALADPATTTSSVNLRAGPGTNFNKLITVPEGSQIELGDCDSSGNWCSITFRGKTGFVSGRYISVASPDNPGWPRQYKTESGAELTLFQPQVSEWKDFNELHGLIAAELRTNKDSKPAYGVIDVSGRTTVDGQSGNVLLDNIKVTELNFSTLDRQQLTDLSIEVGKALPTGAITLSEDRITTSLADYQKLNDVSDLKSDPPVVLVSKVPAILVQTDGKAVIAPVKGVDGLSFVVNTNWDVFKTDADNKLYLRDGKAWLSADDLAGTWAPASELPDLLSKLPDEDNWKDVKGAIPPGKFDGDITPKVFYSDKPAELLQFDGDPKLEPVSGTGLEWASNSESDVFFRKADSKWYILTSGRWFSSSSLDGPWVFATPDLPDDFRNLPDDAHFAEARASIPKTSENAEARLRASIPEKARVATDGSVKVDVAYSGDPKFEPIAGTSLKYAVNTNDTIIEVSGKYYVLKNGVWFVGDSATGPFVVATSVPAEVYKIPPSSPVYNATYVRVYDTEPGAVWFGYTMGYLGAFLAWDTLVYGTGWYYPPYWDFGWSGGYWPYYPRPATYGFGAYYNPARGTFGRYGYAYGPYRGIGGGAAYNPVTGTYFRGAAAYGPGGDRGFVAAYNPRTNTAAFARGGHNVYGSWNSGGVQHAGQWMHTAGGHLAGGGSAVNWRTSAGNHGFIAGHAGGDVYAGRDGNVYRHQDGQWQKHTPDGWSPVEHPASENLKQAGQHFASQHPQAANQARERIQTHQNQPVGSRLKERAPENLGIDRANRQIGNQRVLQRQVINRQPARQLPEFNRGGFRGGGFEGAGGFRGGGFRGGGFHGGGGFRGGGGFIHRR